MSRTHTIFKSLEYYDGDDLENLKKEAKQYLLDSFEAPADSADSEPSEDSIYATIREDIDIAYNDAKIELNKELEGKIICIANLGLWNGHRQGYQILSNNLNEILNSLDCDYIDVYLEGQNVKAQGDHHDGHHSAEYREIRTNRNIENLTNKIHNKEILTRSIINYYTKPIGQHVKAIYGI